MKFFRVILWVICFAAFLAARPALAMTIDNSSDTNRDGSAKFSDPDDKFDEMTDSSSTSHPGSLQFKDGNVSSYFNAGPADYSSNRATSAIR